MDIENNVPTTEGTETSVETIEELKARLEAAEKKASDQEGRAKKAEDALKEIKNTNNPSQEKKEEKVAPVNPKPAIDEDSFLVKARLAQTYNNKEIKLAEDYAKMKGVSLEEATRLPGFQADIKAEREIQKSAEVSVDDLPSLQMPTTDDQFKHQFESGQVDTNNPQNKERYKKLLKKMMD